MTTPRVVVTGLGVICAAGRDVDEFWSALTDGTCGLGPLTSERFGAFDARTAGIVPSSWVEDAGFAADTESDRTRAFALIAVREALGRAGIRPDSVAPERLGLVLGKCQATQDDDGAYQPIHRTADVVAGEIGSSGPRILISTACAAGGNCVGVARDKILTGEADVVLAGGVDPLQFGTYAGFSGLRALSAERCRPYSRSGGLNLGEGAAFFVIESEEHARERGADALAEVSGYGLSADAYHATAPDPTGRGGTSAVRRALADAGLGPDDVDYVCGHGTGTPANDSMERKVMRNVFGERSGQVPTSGIKSFLGHTLGAAGAIEAVASVLAIKNQTVPPTIGFDSDEPADSELDFVPNRAREMKVDTLVSTNYAFGGNNVAVVLRAPGQEFTGRGMGDDDVVITGLGPVSATGVGRDEFVASLVDPGDGDTGDGDTGRPDLTGRTYAPRGVWRQANNLSRMAIAAARLAQEDAGLKLKRAELEKVGVIYATSAGSRESVGDYDDSVLSDPNSPAIHSFSNVVLNATGGAVCQALGFRGPTTTICGGAASATLAIESAAETIRSGKAEVVFVVAADEPGLSGEESAGDGVGATAIILESAEHAAVRGVTAHAKLLSHRHVSSADSLLDAEAAVARTLEDIDLTGVDLVYAAESDTALRSRTNGTEIRSTAAVVGGCGSVGAMFDLVALIDGFDRGEAATGLIHAHEPGSLRGSVLLGAS